MQQLHPYAVRVAPSPVPQVEAGSEAPPGRGGAACVAIGGNRVLVYGGADRAPQAFGDFWLLELSGSGHAHWTKVAPAVKLSHK